MRYPVVCAGVAVLLAACSSGGTDVKPLGPPALGIVSGNHQVAVAGDTALGDPVVGKLVRTRGGELAWVPLSVRRVGGRLLDLAVPAAYAQGTVVDGSPVVGAVVCAVSITSDGLTPFTPCTNTDTAGKATFFFTPGTRAGEQLAEIRGTIEDQPTVFDTAAATVEAGAADTVVWTKRTATVALGGTLALHDLLSRASDAYGNAVTDPGVTVVNDGGFTLSHDTVTAGSVEQEGAIVVQVGNVQDTITVSALIDLTAQPLAIEMFCGPGHPFSPTNGGAGVTLDSLAWSGAVDSVVAGSWWVTGTRTEYRSDGTQDNISFSSPMLQGVTQAVGTLWFNDLHHTQPASRSSILVSASPIHYSGGHPACPASALFRTDITEQ